MTSEVLMLNRDAVVIAADSAVTTGTNPHPRYSKAANKIFDLTVHGNVALTIYSAAEIDNVSWELALKQFRKQHQTNPPLSRLEDYVPELITYLENNESLFPTAFRAKLLGKKLFSAAYFVLKSIEYRFPQFADISKPEKDRTSAWESAYTVFKSEIDTVSIHPALTQKTHEEAVLGSSDFSQTLTKYLLDNEAYKFINPDQLVELATFWLVKNPTYFLNDTGIVIAGYGDNEIFPSFQHIRIYGHVANNLLWENVNHYSVTHDNDSWIQPFAQSSMIDRFTDGFDNTLQQIINNQSKEALNHIITDLQANGVEIPDTLSNPILTQRHAEFNTAWKSANWEKNFHPLRRVLNNLSVSEMGHLAESLLVLEALRERVTSPSESVGGPIDVAVITKAEGLIWLKRKHFFEPELNLKYLNRSKF